jgi:hypothetical protein
MNTAPKRVFLHVGAPKTGTSQLQDLLFLNRDELRGHGVLYPAEQFDDQFIAALDLIGKRWGGLEERAQGTWARLVEQVNGFDGHTVVISHEVFAGATAEQARRALRDLDGQVHVVCSARDLRRQVPAEWQEGVKHRRALSYATFCADLVSDSPRTELVRWFWTVQDLPAVLERWGATLPAERVHLVTVPPPGAPHDLLVERFLGLLGIDAAWLPNITNRANASMGAAETTLVRRLNDRLPGSRLDGEVYRPYVRELLVHRTLAARPGSVRLTLPADLEDWARERTQEWLRRLDEAGYDVVGDLAELAPAAAAPADWYDPDTAPAEDQLAAALEVIETLVLEIGHLTARHREELDAARVPAPGPWLRTKQSAVRLAGRNRAAGALHAVYRWMRRRQPAA